MVTEEQVIKENKGGFVNWCICNYLWYNRSFTDTLKGFVENDDTHQLYRPAKMIEAVLKIMKTMTTEEGVNKFITKVKKTYVSPSYKTVQHFIDGEYETEGLTAQTIATIVSQELAEVCKIFKAYKSA